MIDIHCHLLPAVDDGPGSVEESVELLRVAHLGGTRKMVATPHMYSELFPTPSMTEVNDAYARLIVELKKRSEREEHSFLSELTICLGAENYASPELLEALSSGEVITLNGGKYLLVEFPVHLPLRQMGVVVDRVLGAGLLPVLAHVERYAVFQEDVEVASTFLERGCLLQVNANSFLGPFWSQRRRTAKELLDAEKISVIASDGHNTTHRTPDLSESFQKLGKSYPAETLSHLFTENPAWILNRTNL